MDRVQTRTDPLTRQESYAYDGNGNVTQTTDRKSQVTTWIYDPLNRLTEVVYQDDGTVRYTYDAVGRLVELSDSVGGTITRSYDGLDRLTQEITPQGTVSYTYDAAGRRTSMTVSGQLPVSYTYDEASRLTTVTQGTAVVTLEYDDANRRTRLALPNGIKTDYAYDAASQLTSLTYAHGVSALGGLTYGYDATGQRTQVGGTWARTLLPAAVASATYNAANHQLTFGDQTLTYDLNGNLTADNENTYTWNARDQLVAITGAAPATFLYDAAGRRQRRTAGGTFAAFVHDGLNPVQEATGTAVVDLLTGLGIDEHWLRAVEDGPAEHYLTDALGSTLALTDPDGGISTEYSYAPFGVASVTGAPSGNAFGYTGREDDGTGLYYYRARYYHPTRQRFISEDPIRLLAGEINLYSYAAHNPLRFVDPLGLDKEDPFDEPGLGTPLLDPIDLIGGVGGLAAKLIGKLAAKQAGKAGGKMVFELAPRVTDQLASPRLGPLAGRLTPDRLQDLLNNPTAQRFLDATTGNINVIQQVEGVLLRITTPRDAFRIISVGPIREKGVINAIERGRFVPLP